MKRLAILLLAIVFISGCTSYQTQQTYEPSGRAVFSISDAKSVLTPKGVGSLFETIASVQLTIKNITVYNENTDKWEIVLTEEKIFDLLELKNSGTQVLLADVQLPPGKYIHILMEVSSVKVLDESATEDAKLPSKKLLIITDFLVEENSTTATNVDFVLDKSLHITGNNEYVLVPVIKVSSHMKADVGITSKNEVNVKSSPDPPVTIDQGMNLQGAIAKDFQLVDDIELEIDAEGAVKVAEIAEIQLPIQVTTKNQTNTTAMQRQNFTVRADDYMLDPKEITVKKGSNVTIKFLVSADKVYYGGLDFKGPWGSTGKIAPGAAGEVSFIADENFTYTSYWPASSARKADGHVIVE